MASDHDERDLPRPEDLDPEDDDEAGEDTVECPTCGREVYAGAPRCPGCGEWLEEDSPAARRASGWFWPAVVAVLIAMILVMWHGLGR